MKSANTSIIAGIVLIGLGGLLLLDRLGVMDSAAIVAPLIFAAAGVLFLSVFVRRRENWWAAIPGSVFLGLAAVITASELTGGAWGAAFLFLFMGAGFAAVFLRERTNWWALIPSGVMFTLAAIVALPQEMQGTPTAAVLFLGLAATFAALSLVPVRNPGPAGDHTLAGGHTTGRMRWPLIPAGILTVMGLIFALQATVLFISLDFAFPAVMILAGIALMVYAYVAHRGGRQKAHSPGPRAG
ncbi:uncharacterized membrane protein HdeD (DUF308 family) [Arthrobacter ulcerisalmonis]|uniref:hypothetical protein n=1 Tax=Arthrobacter sp. B1I2 TaxID=3042263 RepID=UPI00278475B6|nr:MULTISPECIES: hypothetical protein [Arthrobacter]MDQ0665336.1 uncharacterized membrane protein HdeD (DUF308 family) [Arthrobacter ulcerisalmonis]MDQ0733030.1 uncharacterized membrane protein HdeD (DUF308 family) [Arthrobacter sp. B1I2]